MISNRIFLHPIDHFFYESKEGNFNKQIFQNQKLRKEENKDSYFEENKKNDKYNDGQTDNSFSSDINISDEEFNFEFLNTFAEESNFKMFSSNAESTESSVSSTSKNFFGYCNSKSNSFNENGFYTHFKIISIRDLFNYFNHNDLNNEIKIFKEKLFEKFKSIIYKKISLIGKESCKRISLPAPKTKLNLEKMDFDFMKNYKNQNIFSKVNNSKYKQEFLSLSNINNNNNFYEANNLKINNNNKNVNKKNNLCASVSSVSILNKNFELSLNTNNEEAGKIDNKSKKSFSIFSLLNENSSKFFSQIKNKNQNENKNIFAKKVYDYIGKANQKNFTSKFSDQSEVNFSIKKSSEFVKKINIENSIFNLINEEKLLINKNINSALKNSLTCKRKNNYFDNCRKNNPLSLCESKLKISDMIKREIDIESMVQNNNIYSFYLQNKQKIVENFEFLKIKKTKQSLDCYNFKTKDKKKLGEFNEEYRSFNFFMAKDEKEISENFYLNNSKQESKLDLLNNNKNNEIFDIQFNWKTNSFLINEDFPKEMSSFYEKSSKLINDAFKY